MVQVCLSRVHVGSLLTRETAAARPETMAPGPMARSSIHGSGSEVRISSGPCFWTHVHMTCFTDKRYEGREYLYTSWTCTERQPGDV